MASQVNSTKHLEKSNTQPSQILPKIAEEGTLTSSYHETTITLVLKSEKDITQKENYRAVSLMNTRHQNPQQSTNKQNPTIHKKDDKKAHMS